MLKRGVVLLMPDEDGHMLVRSGYPPDDRLTEAERAAAQWSWDQGEAAGRGTDTLPGADIKDSYNPNGPVKNNVVYGIGFTYTF